MADMALIAGGVRSGKSAYALRWAEQRGPRKAFIATAQAFDDEMRTRIENHRVERANSYLTVEAPIELSAALMELRDVDVVVVDCLTLFISNLLLADKPDAEIEQRLARLAEQLAHAPFASIVVSNEVGMGIVPDNALSRRFRDLTGRGHQLLSARASHLYLATMGTVLRLRPGPVEVCHPGPVGSDL